MGHFPADGIPCPDGAFLSGTDKAVLGLAYNGSGNGICVSSPDKVLYPEHLVFFIAQHPAEDRSIQTDAGPFECDHGDEHGRQIPLGIAGASAVHSIIYDFSPKRIVSPGSDIARSHNIRVSFKKKRS